MFTEINVTVFNAKVINVIIFKHATANNNLMIRGCSFSLQNEAAASAD